MPTRRDVLKLIAASSVLATAATPALAAPVPAPAPAPGALGAPGLPGVHKPLPPELFTLRGTNAETNFAALRSTGALTPVSHFFVRNHTSTPVLSERDWRLTVWGDGLRGQRPFTLTYGQLRSLPAVTRTCVVECAGNGRSFFGSQQGQPATGTPWTLGAIGAARWRGARLSDVLRLAGISGDAVDVMPRGLDDPYVADGVDHGRVRRPLPVAKALDDVILAYEMNGAPLPHDHGFPVRVVVPAWVGIASIKWVGDIEVSARPLESPWTMKFYRLFGAAYPPGGSAPISRQTVKSAWELPLGAELAGGRAHRLTGRSWSAHAPVRHVEVSTDGGAHWHRARLTDRPRSGTWTRWSTTWRPKAEGPGHLLARTTDTAGNVQPTVTVPNTQGYLFDAVVRHPVLVV